MDRWPLSLTQESYSTRLRGLDERPVNVTLALGLDDPPSELIEQHLRAICSREPLLRASLDLAEPATLTIHDRPRVPLSVTDGLDPAVVGEQVQHDTQHVFAAGEPLWRAHLLRTADRTTTLSLNFHHLVFDGVSRGLFLRSLASAAHANSANSAAPYAEFAHWQRERFTADGEDMRFWRDYLKGWAHNQHVPLGFAKNLDQPLDNSCRHHAVRLAGVATWQVLRWGRRHGVSLFMQVLAALSVALGEATEAPENLVRATFHGRPSGFERTIGCFGQDVTLRLPTHQVALADALASTRHAWDELGDHKFTPYRCVRQAAGGSALPFRPVIVTLNSFSTPTAASAFGEEAAVLDVPEFLPEEGLHLQLSQTPQALTLECSYHPVRFASQDIEQFLQRIMSILQEPHR
ncbi:condensation domain-containing protein [Streptomyces sp. NBC_01465]|uniref:condensation domain-containing protein n=1 Tax=Streptomyces sp. NBC_01465 TaxID=2903878 RepID=UPI002E3373FD|nr:condensation domain-containing protein [Streptomyces sp. NBC_01465]